MASPSAPVFTSPSPLTISAAESRLPIDSLPQSPSPPVSPSSPAGRRSRGASITDSIINSRPPLGALAATGSAFGRAPSLSDLRRNSSGSVGTGKTRRGSSASARGLSPSTPVSPSMNGLDAAIMERKSEDVGRPYDSGGTGRGFRTNEHNEVARTEGMVDNEPVHGRSHSLEANGNGSGNKDENEDEEKLNWWGATKNGLLAFWRFFITPMGFCITIYMLNVIAWGGMLFLLLCNAAPAMCNPTCDDINSPRRVWIEIDSQILNALFCVTGFGLVPWRFRDLYYLLKWRCGGKQSGYKKLQEINEAWYRPAEGSQIENGENGAADTATGVKAPPTKSWKLDYVIWLYVWNTFFQCCLSGFMWGMNRYDRPPWSTGLFVALAFIVAGLAGGQVWWETRKVKRIEGEKKKEEGEKKRNEGEDIGGMRR